MSALPEALPPYVWTREAYARAWTVNATEDALPPFASVCVLCGFPNMYYRPVKEGRSWSGHCTRCGSRTFSRLPRAFYAPSMLLEPLRGRGHAALGEGVRHIERLGAGFEAGTCWDDLSFGATRRRQMRHPVACLACGEAAAATVRRDRYQNGYLICGSCDTRTFVRADHCLRMAGGYSLWLQAAGGADAWLAAYRQGQETWKGWLALGSLAAASGEAREQWTDNASEGLEGAG